jgi:NADPH:quinone reductase-like Zn-dependent oxidoreductase
VACIGTGTARSCYYDQASAFQKIEENVSFELAASLPLAYTAAYYIVNELARIKRGGTVLIHDAASWYGKALAEICMLNGSEIFAIVSNEDSKNEILDTFGIASWQVIVDGKDNIARRLLELTNGKPPSTVITSADSNTKIFKTLCKLTAPFGHLIHLRTRPLEDHQAVGLFSWDLKNISFSTFDIFNFQFQTIVPIYEIWSKVISLFKQRKLRGSSSYSVHKVTNVTNAMSAVSSAKYAVITANADEIISVRLSLNTVI